MQHLENVLCLLNTLTLTHSVLCVLCVCVCVCFHSDNHTVPALSLQQLSISLSFAATCNTCSAYSL